MFQRFAKLALGWSASSRAPVGFAAVTLAAVLSPLLAVARQVDPPPAEAGTAPAADAPAADVSAPDVSAADGPAGADSPKAAEPAAVAPPAPLDPAAALLALGQDLELQVTETGPDQPWTLHLHNRGATPIGVM